MERSFVPDSQPWRNPRRAPDLREIQNEFTPRLRGSWTPHWLRSWWPALAWASVIFIMSTERFSAEHTAAFFEPLLRWLIPSLTAAQFGLIHHLIRKSAHFTEYFVFCVLLYRAVRGGGPRWSWAWAFTALFIAAGYSILDEVHQAFVAGRVASPYDSLLDSIGAFVAVLFLWLWFRLHLSKPAS